MELGNPALPSTSNETPPYAVRRTRVAAGSGPIREMSFSWQRHDNQHWLDAMCGVCSASKKVHSFMAEKATESHVDQEENKAAKTPARAPRKRAAAVKEPVSEAAKDAVAESLAELAEVAPKRTTRRRPVKKDGPNPDDLLNALPVKEDEAPKAKAAPRKRAPKKVVEETPAIATAPLFASAEEPVTAPPVELPPMTALLFQEPDVAQAKPRRKKVEKPAVQPEVTEETTPATEEDEPEATPRRRRGSRGRGKNITDKIEETSEAPVEAEEPEQSEERPAETEDDAALEPGVTRRRRRRRGLESASDEVASPKGSTRLEAKRQRRKEGRDQNRRRHTVTESEYLARRESVKREMLVREQDGLNQIAVLEDDILVEHYVARHTQVSMVGNVYLGRVQNVLPSMEAAFVDIGKGRNAVLYAGEVNWDAAGMDGKPRRIEQALQSGDTVLVQVTKDPIGQKGARLTAQITLAGRHLVLVPNGAMTGISRKLPDKERQRLKKLLREIVPPEHGVIVRTAAEGASEEQLRADVERLTKSWEDIQQKSKNYKSAPVLLKGEPELAVRVIRDIFNEDFNSLTVQGDEAWRTISEYVGELSPELSARLSHWTSSADIFAEHRVDEQLAKAFDRKVWLPSGGTLVIDRMEAMTVVDVNTGKFTGSGGTLEETVTRNNLEAAEEIVRQLRLRDIGGIIVIDFIDMVLESNRELVLRRMVECLGRDRTRHQVAEVTSLGLVQMTRKRVGQGLVEAFSTTCEACDGRGFITHTHPVERTETGQENFRRKKNKAHTEPAPAPEPTEDPKRDEVRAALNSIAAAAAKGHDAEGEEIEVVETQAATPKKKGNGKQRTRRNGNATKKAGGEAPAEAVAEPSQSAERQAEREVAPAVEREAAPAAESEPTKAAPVVSKPAKAARSTSEPARKPRRVVSSGTITPGSATGAILSFPAN